jgi:hypothetical protein
MNAPAKSHIECVRKLGGAARLGVAALAWAFPSLVAASAAVGEPVNGPDLVLWLDAQDIAGKGTNGGPIATWTDKSSHRNDAHQTIPSQRPIGVCEAAGGEVPFVLFHAASRKYLSVSNAPWLGLSSLTAFGVARAGESGGQAWPFGKNQRGPLGTVWSKPLERVNRQGFTMRARSGRPSFLALRMSDEVVWAKTMQFIAAWAQRNP